MASLIWAPSALKDIEAIAEYISRDSPANASLFIDRIIEQTERLAEFPMSGRVIPEIGQESAREIIYGNYRIMYSIRADEIWITGVIHGARDCKKE